MLEDGDARASTTFFTTLERELRARSATLPCPMELEPTLGPLLRQIGDLDQATPDLDVLAERLEDAVAENLGLPIRRQREEAAEARIDREVAAHIAASMRRHGLVPAEDLDDDDESGGHGAPPST